MIIALSLPADAIAEMLPPIDPQTEMRAVMADPQKARAALMPYVTTPGSARADDVSTAFSLIARSYEVQGRYADAIGAAEKLYAIAQQRHDLRLMAEAMGDMGAYNRPLGNLDLAVRQLKQAADLAARAKDPNLWSEALFNLSVLMLLYGDYENALSYNQESQKVMQMYGGLTFPASGYAARSNIYFRLDRMPEALTALEQAQSALHPDDHVGATQLLGLRAMILERQGHDDAAQADAQKCLDMRKAAKIELQETYSCEIVLADVALKLRHLDQARAHFDMIRAILKETPDSAGVAKLLLQRDYHMGLADFARVEGRLSDEVSERAAVGEIDRKLSSARESSRAAIAAAQIATEGKDLSIALLEERNANLRLQERQRLTWIISAIVSLLAVLGGLFIWYRARQQRLRQEQRHSERTRIARDLHDTLLQNMAGTQLQLQAAAIQAAREQSPLASRLDTMVDQLSQAMASARDAVWQMRSAAIDRGDLVGAIEEWLGVARAGAMATIGLEVTPGKARLTANQAEDLFRIVQEAVGNALRHARASTIAVHVGFGDKAVELGVSDNGCGFDMATGEAQPGAHWGLVGMRERATRLGGTLAIESAPGNGTRIILTIPA